MLMWCLSLLQNTCCLERLLLAKWVFDTKGLFLPLIALTHSYRRRCVSHAMVRKLFSQCSQSRCDTCDHNAKFLATFLPFDVHVTSMDHFISWCRSPLSYEDSCKFCVLEKFFGVALRSWRGWQKRAETQSIFVFNQEWKSNAICN